MASADERIAAIEKRRAERAVANEAARKEQFAIDMEALDGLEEQHGHERVFRVVLDGWQAGHGAATLVAYRLPLSSEAVVKRFLQQANATNPNAQQRVEASDALAKACIVYPEHGSDAYRATFEISPGLYHAIAKQIFDRVSGRAQEEGK